MTDPPEPMPVAHWAAQPLPTEIVCWGAKGHALIILQEGEAVWRGRVQLRAFVDEEAHGHDHPVLGVPVISPAERLATLPGATVLVGVNNPGARARIQAQVVAEGGSVLTFVGDARQVHPSARLGPGVLVALHTRIGPGTVIEAGAHVFSTMVAHDVHVGAAATLGPYSSILGHVDVGEGANVAPHAVVHNGSDGRRLTIGAGATVGVGAVVTRDVPEGGVVVGNPAMGVEEWRRLRALASQ